VTNTFKAKTLMDKITTILMIPSLKQEHGNILRDLTGL